MSRYLVEVSTVISRSINVEADTPEEAEDAAIAAIPEPILTDEWVGTDDYEVGAAEVTA
jgi:hypothetical protein